MTDLWADFVVEDWLAVCQDEFSSNAVYLWLTKRVEYMASTLDYHRQDPDLSGNFPNHYFGFTAEDQEWYDRRRMQCVDMPSWENLWISCEPLLGSINYLLLTDPVVKARTKWIVVGCESGPNRRPCKIEWVESIVEQCRAANVPVFVKQLDIGGKCVTDINKFPTHLRIRQVPWAKEGETK